MSDLPPSQTPLEATDTIHIAGAGGPWTPQQAADLAPLPRGASVGRYLVLDAIGRGGMGVVYAGYDPELDRKVALKLLRPDRTGSSGEGARLRLLREAQAIARLSHPNVVSVYDTGTFDDQVFVAMELVEGRNLRQWLGEAQRSWRDVLAVLLPAGRGLAAAHAAGLVHRDFKPENVLLGRDGRVRVADFGLARQAGRSDEETEVPAAEVSPLAAPLTGWGIAVGTPAYMAPEQLRGEPADARSDQYAFCVTLYEALYGERPAVDQEGRETAADRRVPSWLRQVVLRGLHADPERRHPSMDDLLAALEHDPAVLRRRWLAAAALVVVAAGGLIAWGRERTAHNQLCRGAESRVAGVWSADRKGSVQAAFVATGLPQAGKVWALVERALDEHTGRWATMHREACEATRLRGEQSEDLLDRRMFCLDQRLQEVDATVGLFAHADAQVVEKALTAVSSLPRIETCADREALTAKVPPPRDPELRARVEAVRAKVAEVLAGLIAGKHKESLPKARVAVDLARRLGYRPLEAEALFEQARLQDVSGDLKGAEATLFDALVAAEAAGHQEFAAQAASQLAAIVGHKLSRPEEGHRWARLAEGMAEGGRMGDNVRSGILRHLGMVLAEERRFTEARAVSLRALSLAERSLGPEQPDVASLLTNISAIEDQMGHEEEAIRYLRRGLAIREKVLPPGHPDFGRSYTTLGNILMNLGREEEALSAFRRAHETFRHHYGPDHLLALGALYSMGLAYKDTGRLDEALRCFEQVLPAFEKGFGPENPLVGMTLSGLGDTLALQGRHEESLAAFRRVLAIFEKNLSPDNPDLAVGLIGVSNALLELGRVREALPLAERALALREGRPIDPGYIAEARFLLARSLWDGGGDRQRALRQARLSLDGYGASAVAVAERKQAEEWLAARGAALGLPDTRLASRSDSRPPPE
jgi:eukaryotic-like serine/threonine-protein kinase